MVDNVVEWHGFPSKGVSEKAQHVIHKVAGTYVVQMAPDEAPATAMLYFITPSSMYSMLMTPSMKGMRKPPPLCCLVMGERGLGGEV